MVKSNQECKCKEILEILEQTRHSIEQEYSNFKIINADFVRTQKAMFYEKIDNLFRVTKAEKEADQLCLFKRL